MNLIRFYINHWSKYCLNLSRRTNKPLVLRSCAFDNLTQELLNSPVLGCKYSQDEVSFPLLSGTLCIIRRYNG